MFSFLQRFKPKQITVVRASTKKQREADKRKKELHIALAKGMNDTQALARLNECWEAK